MTKNLHIDHLVYAVPDLAAAVIDLEARFGVAPSPGGAHVGLGTFNALLDSAGARTSRSSDRIQLNRIPRCHGRSVSTTSTNRASCHGVLLHDVHSPSWSGSRVSRVTIQAKSKQ